MGNYEDCLHDLKKLDDMYPKDPQINYHLGQVYIKLGHANLGFTHMTRATKLDPKGTAQQKGTLTVTMKEKLKFHLTQIHSPRAQH